MLASGCYNDSVWQCWMQLKQGNLQFNDAEKLLLNSIHNVGLANWNQAKDTKGKW